MAVKSPRKSTRGRRPLRARASRPAPVTHVDIRLVLVDFCGCWVTGDRRPKSVLCTGGFRDYFNVPRDAAVLHCRLSSKPPRSPEVLEFRQTVDGDAEIRSRSVFASGGSRPAMLYDGEALLTRCRKRLGVAVGAPLYLEAWYE